MNILTGPKNNPIIEHPDGMTEPARSCWKTPQWLFDALNREFHFNLDAAADTQNALVGRFLNRRSDAFACPWNERMPRSMQPRAFLNPPYSGARAGERTLMEWHRLCVEEMQRGSLVAMLAPSDTGTLWFKDAAKWCHQIRLISPRIEFGIPHPDIARSGNSGATAVFIYDPKRKKDRSITVWDVSKLIPAKTKGKV